MNGLILVLLTVCWFGFAYLVYGAFLKRLFGVEPSRPTPAKTREDGVDYVPARFPVLFGHHFASIAGAGPIVGPVAAIYLGWLPALLWILIGCVFVGAMHDFAALFLSVRDEGRSIGHVIEQQIGYAGRQIFLLFSWAALVLVVTIFALFVAKTFAANPSVATASLLFIVMAPVFGVLIRRNVLSVLVGSLIFVPLLFVGVWIGTRLPIDVASRFDAAIRSRGTVTVSPADAGAAVAALGASLEKGADNAADVEAENLQAALDQIKTKAAETLSAGTDMSVPELQSAGTQFAEQVLASVNATAVNAELAGRAFADSVIHTHAVHRARNVWLVILFIYVFVASVLPVWLLLQPRDYLNSYLLYAMIVLGFLGIVFSMPSMRMPALNGWVATNAKGHSAALFPLLFVTVACGACSGFHALVASGTTAKQVADERQILPIGYGGMLVEGVLAVMALISVGYLVRSDYDVIINTQGNVAAFASGLANFCTTIGLPLKAGKTFIALAISAFMLTTLDTATRLTRFAWQELFLPKGAARDSSPTPLRRWVANPFAATAIAIGCAAYLAFSGDGMTIWPVFGASNQLLAALTLLAVTLYLMRKGRLVWVAALPLGFMIAISGWALVILLKANWGRNVPLVVATTFLLAMAILLAMLAVKSVKGAQREGGQPPADTSTT